MYKYYIVEWAGETPWGQFYVGRERFEMNEKAEMRAFIFRLMRKKAISKIWKTIHEEGGTVK